MTVFLLGCFGNSKVNAAVLYDGNLRSLPDRQGWLFLVEPPFLNLSRQVIVERAVNLNTMRNVNDQAGYFARSAERAHPLLKTFDRESGFQIAFTLQMLSENHLSSDRAGFGFIVISHDLFGIEMGFWTNAIFAQSADRTRAETNDSLPFRLDEYVDFILEIKADQYVLSGNGSQILSGKLRDYSDLGTPYDIADFLFFGDASHLAAASTNIRSIQIDTELGQSVPPPIEPIEPEPSDLAEAIFILDEEASHLSITGSVLSGMLQPQGEGSLTTNFGGELHTLLSSTNILFKSDSRIDAQINGEWTPQSGGESGSAPADFGAKALVGGIANATASAREIAFSVSSLPLDLQNLQEGTEFSVEGMQIEFPEESPAAIDFSVGGLLSIDTSLSLSGLIAENKSTTPATFLVKENLQTLTIPVDAVFSFRIFSPDDATMRFTGTIVASREIEVHSDAVPVLSISLFQDEVQVKWEAILGRRYALESSSDLVDWVVMESRIATNDVETLIAKPDENQFYRTVLLPSN